jgi:hypothetical protein
VRIAGAFNLSHVGHDASAAAVHAHAFFDVLGTHPRQRCLPIHHVVSGWGDRPASVSAAAQDM